MNAAPQSDEFHRQGKSLRTSLRPGLRITKRSRTGLSALLQSTAYAEELDRSVWDFAVEIAVLRKAGLSYSDLRWLICKGYVAHAYEIPPESQDSRCFRDSPKLTFTRSSCFVAKERGIEFIRRVLDLQTSGSLRKSRTLELGLHNVNGNSIVDGPPDRAIGGFATTVPIWDRDRQELRVGQQVVKQFKAPAPNQELILSVFQEDGWPVRIDDPLPPSGTRDPKRRLHDTINSLNRCHKVFLLRFLGDGRASGIRWELVPRE